MKPAERSSRPSDLRTSASSSTTLTHASTPDLRFPLIEATPKALPQEGVSGLRSPPVLQQAADPPLERIAARDRLHVIAVHQRKMAQFVERFAHAPGVLIPGYPDFRRDAPQVVGQRVLAQRLVAELVG